MRVGLAAIAIVLAACGEDVASDGVGRTIAPPPEPEARPAIEELYGPDGMLLESDQRVAGLVLPRGLTEVASFPRRHVYASRAPVEKLLRYFGPRLMTLDIEQRGPIATYRDAVPRDARGGVVHLDVTIQPSSSSQGTVEIFERPPATTQADVSEDELRRALEALTKNRE